MHYDFVIEKHEEHGTIGLKALFLLGAQPAQGFTCAHDIMEHFPGTLDSDSEAMALGAMLYVRGEGGFFDLSRLSIAQNISGDISSLDTEAHMWGDITNPGKTIKLQSDEAEAWIEESIKLAIEEIIEEYGQEPPHKEWGAWVRGWLRKGYRKASRRYQADSCSLTHAFMLMTAHLDEGLKRAEQSDIVRLSFVSKTLDMNVTIISPWDIEHPDYEPIDDEDDYSW